MDQFLFRAGDFKQAVTAAGHFPHARPDKDHKVAFANKFRQFWINPDADIANEMAVRVRNIVLTTETGGDRNIVSFCKRFKVFSGFCGPTTTTNDHDRPFCICQCATETGDVFWGGFGFDRDIGFGIGNLGCRGQHIFRQGKHDRSGAAGGRDMIGVADIFRDAVDVIDLGDPLAKRFEHLAIIDFLECFTVDHVPSDLPDEKDHRGAVLMGDMHTC